MPSRQWIVLRNAFLPARVEGLLNLPVSGPMESRRFLSCSIDMVTAEFARI